MGKPVLGPFLPEAMTFTLVGFCALGHATYTVQTFLGNENRHFASGSLMVVLFFLAVGSRIEQTYNMLWMEVGQQIMVSYIKLL